MKERQCVTQNVQPCGNLRDPVCCNFAASSRKYKQVQFHMMWLIGGLLQSCKIVEQENRDKPQTRLFIRTYVINTITCKTYLILLVVYIA